MAQIHDTLQCLPMGAILCPFGFRSSFDEFTIQSFRKGEPQVHSKPRFFENASHFGSTLLGKRCVAFCNRLINYFRLRFRSLLVLHRNAPRISIHVSFLEYFNLAIIVLSTIFTSASISITSLFGIPSKYATYCHSRNTS